MVPLSGTRDAECDPPVGLADERKREFIERTPARVASSSKSATRTCDAGSSQARLRLLASPLLIVRLRRSVAVGTRPGDDRQPRGPVEGRDRLGHRARESSTAGLLREAGCDRPLVRPPATTPRRGRHARRKPCTPRSAARSPTSSRRSAIDAEPAASEGSRAGAGSGRVALQSGVLRPAAAAARRRRRRSRPGPRPGSRPPRPPRAPRRRPRASRRSGSGRCRSPGSPTTGSPRISSQPSRSAS